MKLKKLEESEERNHKLKQMYVILALEYKMTICYRKEAKHWDN